MGDPIWLDVPFSDKDAAKAAGARWNPQLRRWYAPRPNIRELDPWLALPELPELLPGEDRTFGSGLFVDLIPASCWFTNVRSCVDARDWDRLRRMVYDRAANECEACGAAKNPAAQIWMEAHERWAYDGSAGIQSLTRLICLCSPCHRATHFGFAEVTGHAEEALQHLMDVNDWDRSTARRHVEAAAQLWTQRSRLEWELDLTMLTAAGLRLAAPPQAQQRRTTAEKTLRSTQTAAAGRAASAGRAAANGAAELVPGPGRQIPAPLVGRHHLDRTRRRPNRSPSYQPTLTFVRTGGLTFVRTGGATATGEVDVATTSVVPG